MEHRTRLIPLIGGLLLATLSACTEQSTQEGETNQHSPTAPSSAVASEPLDPDDNSFPETYIAADVAVTAARNAGLGERQILFQDVIPADLDGDGVFEPVWVVAASPDSVWYVEPWKGSLLQAGPPTPGLQAYLDEVVRPAALAGKPLGQTPDTYESFPWGWNLPFLGAMYVSCGYGCGYHTGSMRYALDWNLNGSKDCGNPVAAPLSGWVMDASYNGGYGYQLVIRGASAGNGQYFIWRGSHFPQASSMRPGWWVSQGRIVAAIGTTGNSSGCHLHSEAWRGTTNGKSISGSTVPWNAWPAAADNVDGYNGSTGTCFSSGNGGTSGDMCP